MLLIDKTLPQQRLIVTIPTQTITEGNYLILHVKNKADNKDYRLTLPTNTSNYKFRYDEFIIPTSSVQSWTEGQYIYEIREVNDDGFDAMLEGGLITIVGTVEEQNISIEEDEAADDYIIYE